MPKIANVPTTGCAYLIIFHYNYLYNLLRSFKCYHSGILIKEECKLSNVISSRVIYITQCCFSKLKYLHLLACYYVSYICIHRYIIYKYYLYYVNIYIYIYIHINIHTYIYIYTYIYVYIYIIYIYILCTYILYIHIYIIYIYII